MVKLLVHRFSLLKLSLLFMMNRHVSLCAQECIEGEVRDLLEFRASSSGFAGNVHYCQNGRWVTVCADGTQWTTNETQTVCRQLGYSDMGSRGGFIDNAPNCNGPSHYVDITGCSRDEQSLQNCLVTNRTNNCTCNNNQGDARVACQPANCSNGTVRLVGGSTHREGRVEVCMNGRWGTVCNNSQEGIAGAVCSQLGFLAQEAATFTYNGGDSRSGGIFDCNIVRSSSSMPINCTASSECNHSMDLGVTCQTYQSIAKRLNSTLQQCDMNLTMTVAMCQSLQEQLNGVQSQVAVLRGLLAVAVVLLVAVIVGWLVTCIVSRSHLSQLCTVRREKINTEERRVDKEFHTHKESQNSRESPCDGESDAVHNVHNVLYAQLDIAHMKKENKERKKTESSHGTEAPSEGRPHPVKPPKYTGTYTRDKSSDGGGQEDKKSYPPDESWVQAAPDKNFDKPTIKPRKK